MEGMDGGSFTMSFNSSQPRGHNAAAVAVSDDGLIKFSNYNNITILQITDYRITYYMNYKLNMDY